jgi:hypothetical protein
LKKALEESINEYVISDFTLKSYLELGEIRTSLKTREKEEIPPYVIERYRRGLFPIGYMGVLMSGRHILHVQVENSNEVSAHNCSSELRRVNYGIIIKPMKVGKESKEIRKKVTEWSRDGRGLLRYTIQPLCEPINGYGELPSLENLKDLEVDKRRKLLLIVLEADTKAIKSLPDDFQLLATSVRYWITKATPRVNLAFVQALLLVHLQLLAESEAKSSPKPSRYKKKKYSRSEFDINCQHSFAQWQAVVMETLCLNHILLDPFLVPEIATLYNGVRAQTIVQEIKRGKYLLPGHFMSDPIPQELVNSSLYLSPSA